MLKWPIIEAGRLNGQSLKYRNKLPSLFHTTPDLWESSDEVVVK